MVVHNRENRINAFLIHRGKTLEPAGLNRRDEMQFNLATFQFSFVYFTLLSSIINFPPFYAFPFLFILHIT